MTRKPVMALLLSGTVVLAVLLAAALPLRADDNAADIAAAEQELRAGHADRAANLLRDILSRLLLDDTANPEMAEVALRLSRVDQLGGNLEAAERPLLEAIPHLTKAGVPARAGLARLYIELGHLTLARGALNRAQIALMKGTGLARTTVAADDPMLLEAELSLATAEIRAFRLDAADRRLSALEQRVAQSGADQAQLRAQLTAIRAEWFFRRYDFSAALAAQQQALALFVALYGPQHPETARAATSLAGGLFNAGQYKQAEQSLLRAIGIYEADAVFFAPALATALVNLGHVYYATGRPVLAISALTRAESLAVASVGADSQIVAAARLHRGYTQLREGDLAGAIADLKAAIAIWSGSEAANSRAAAGAQVWLAEALRRQGDLAGAEAALGAAREVLLPLFGADGYAASDLAIGQGEIDLARAAPAAAVAAFQQATDIRQRLVGPDHLTTLDARGALALALAESGATGAALELARGDIARVGERIAIIQAAQSESALEEIAALRRLIGRYLQIIELALGEEKDDGKRRELLTLSLRLAQMSRSSAAGTAIASLAQRFSTADPAGLESLRALQENLLRWQVSARQLTAMAVDGRIDTKLQAETGTLSQGVTALRARIIADHPAIAAMMNAAPRGAAEIQAELRPGEVLIAYAALDEQSYAWVVTPQDIAFQRLPANAYLLRQQVARLRTTLDPREVSSLSDIKPYDVATARSLYDALLAPVTLSPDTKHLIIVADGTLQSLPFAALLTGPASAVDDFAAYRRLPWLIARYDLSFLPEIGALVDLRAVAAPSAARAPFLGIGDPVLAGQPPATEAGADAAVMNAALVSSLAPLPESRDELAGLAEALAAGPDSLIVGTAANETGLKGLPLAQYRVVAFATHGLMAGDFGRLREPGLALTPPERPAGEDDGLLTIGEIARLRLDADWVVLSACNTAAADGSPGAEGLSGLARAFFFAGSRSLLVSQWEVLSVAAVELTTGIFRHQASSPNTTRAAALRASILALLAEDQPDYFSHPIFWAPFQLVGEGAREELPAVSGPDRSLSAR